MKSRLRYLINSIAKLFVYVFLEKETNLYHNIDIITNKYYALSFKNTNGVIT